MKHMNILNNELCNSETGESFKIVWNMSVSRCQIHLLFIKVGLISISDNLFFATFEITMQHTNIHAASHEWSKRRNEKHV